MLVPLTITFIDTRLNGQKQKKKSYPSLQSTLKLYKCSISKKESFPNIQNVLLIICVTSLGYTSPSI